MKVLLIGAGGSIGKIITPAIKQRNQVITAGRSTGDIIVDITSAASIEIYLNRLPTLMQLCVLQEIVLPAIYRY